MSKVSEKDFKVFVQEVATVIGMMGTDIGKTQALIYAILEDMGKVEKPNCASCKEQLVIPILASLEKSEVCPNCGDNVYGTTQVSFEDWDNGREEE